MVLERAAPARMATRHSPKPAAAAAVTRQGAVLSLQRAAGNRAVSALLAGRRALQRTWKYRDDGLAEWEEDGKGTKAMPRRGYTAIEKLRASDRERVKKAFGLGDKTEGFAVHTFHVCEIRGRERYRTLRKRTAAPPHDVDPGEIFKTRYTAEQRPKDESYGFDYVRAKQTDIKQDVYHEVRPVPNQDKVEVWATAAGETPALPASEVIYQAVKRFHPQMRVQHFVHHNVGSGTGVHVYGYLEERSELFKASSRVQLPAPADDQQNDWSSRAFYAYLGTDNGSTAFGLLLDHAGHDIGGPTRLKEIVATAGVIEFELA